MIQNRGNIKWGSLMLPEHLELLRECKQTEYVEPPREQMDWELEEMQQTIDQAINQQLEVKLNVWMEGKITQWTGIIKSINFNTNELILETLIKTKRIPLQHVQSTQLEVNYYD
ncbi:YolD-like family protein [Lysinibacillus sp. NPDC093712]|uniref:YolD-like family protein n=1 Tax=Lysinibacillus sp. NPDC093712 TaxID=3390579 RepID=UPI003D06754B